VSLNVHFALACLGGETCFKIPVKQEDSLVFHYRNEPLWPYDNRTILDTTMLKYKDILVRSFNLVLDETGFKP
jgi:hypothetical protein